MPVSDQEYAPKRQEPSPTNQQRRRHALGMPPGSVRALLAFMVLALSWGLMSLQKELPLYLQYLMFLILGHYFASHKPLTTQPEESSPLWLPRGVIRTLIVVGFIAVAGYMVYQHMQHSEVFTWSEVKQKYMPMILVIGFFAGMLVSRIGAAMYSGPTGTPAWIQDMQAWLALLAMVALAGVILLELVINPSMEQTKQIVIPKGVEGVLAALVGYYFGARS